MRTITIMMICFLMTACSPSPDVQNSNAHNLEKAEFGLHFEQNALAEKGLKLTFEGTYQIKRLYYSNFLSLLPNNEFTYLESSCLGSVYSEGTWKKEGNFIILNSASELAAPDDWHSASIERFGDLTTTISFEDLKLEIKDFQLIRTDNGQVYMKE